MDYTVDIIFIGSADIFVLIQRETERNLARWPNKIGDYLASGRLILTNPFGEIEAYVKKFPEAFIATNFDAESIASVIKRVYPHKENLLERGKKVREITENYMSWRSKAIEVEAFYNHIIDRKNRKVNVLE